ncbi:MAG: hypothetical protein AAB588_04335 [Patescibacteria group bacterium]
MPFTQDFLDLQNRTPRLAIIHTNSENSAYTNYSTFNRNCYLVSGTHYSEDVFYAQYCVGLTSCCDCLDVEKSELCYECVFAEKCYNCNYGSYLINCFNCDYTWDLTNCQNCFLSCCLQNQSYCILNKQVSKEEYETQKRFLFKNNSPKELLKMLEDLKQKTPQRPTFEKNCENCLGSELRNARNLIFSYRTKNAEDLIYGGTNINQCKSSMDVDNVAATMSEDLYQAIGVTGSYNILCSNVVWFSNNITYSEVIFNSHDCFGCISRNHAEYEILNVKYPKEEYFKRVEAIKDELKNSGQWGQMLLPPTYPFADTIAAQYYTP